jgi:chemotaxis response regulator CheB
MLEPHPFPRRSTKLRTLVAEDCAMMADKLLELLEGIPEIEPIGLARDGAAAVEMTLRLKPELVILDIQMPVMNGIEAARAIRQFAPETRVVLTSAVGWEGNIALAGLARFEFVPKSQLWQGLSDLMEKLFGKNIENGNE